MPKKKKSTDDNVQVEKLQDETIRTEEYQEITRPEDLGKAQENQIPAELVDDDKMAEVRLELERGYREFEFDGVKGRVYFPTVGEDNEISAVYARAYSLYLSMEGILTESELQEIYNKRGIWTDKEQERLEYLEQSIEETKEDLTEVKIAEDMEDKKKRKEILKKFAEQKKHMEEHTELSSKRTSLFSVSAESKARETSMRQRLVCCVKDENGERFWNTLEDLDSEKRMDLYSNVIRTALLFWSGIPDSFLEE